MSRTEHYAANKQVIGLTSDHSQLVQEMKPALEKHADKMVDQFYAQLDMVDEARALGMRIK
jgi:hypothetical protein